MISQKTRQRVENGGAGGQVGCGAPATSVSIDNWAFPMLRMMRMGMNIPRGGVYWFENYS